MSYPLVPLPSNWAEIVWGRGPLSEFNVFSSILVTVLLLILGFMMIGMGYSIKEMEDGPGIMRMGYICLALVVCPSIFGLYFCAPAFVAVLIYIGVNLVTVLIKGYAIAFGSHSSKSSS